MPLSVDSIVQQACFDIAARVPESAYLSVNWFANCIENWSGCADFEVLTLENGERGYALIGRGKQSRHGWVFSRVLALNESMNERIDEVVVELNGFYAGKTELFSATFEQLLIRLLGRDDWDEFRVSGVIAARAGTVTDLARKYGLAVHVHAEKPSYWVDLDHVREQGDGDYLATRSANCRQQLRRALRKLEQRHGKVRLEVAETQSQAQAIFEQIAPLHRARWTAARSGRKYSGFDNPQFVDFHQKLIQRSLGSGSVELLRVLTGSTMIAGLYNIVEGRTCCFYLSGVNYQIGEEFKPGMLAHWLAIEHHLNRGMGRYDFLAGENRYKSSLATHSDRQLWLVLQRPRVRLKLEAAARLVKHRIRQIVHSRSSAE